MHAQKEKHSVIAKEIINSITEIFTADFFFTGENQLPSDSGQQVQHISSERIWRRPDIAYFISNDIQYILNHSFIYEYLLSPISNAGHVEMEYAILHILMFPAFRSKVKGNWEKSREIVGYHRLEWR